MTMTDEIQLADPDDLTSDEELLLEELENATPEEYDDLVRRYVAHPTESDQMVFRHPDVVEKTHDSLNRLIAAAQQRKQHARDPRKRRLADDQIVKLGRERKAIRPYLNLALAEAARNSSRARAERLLGRIMYKELKAIIRDFDAGMTEREAEERAKERFKSSKT